MIEITNKRLCSGCNACKAICPVNAIKMVEDEEGFLYPIVDKEKCIKCNLCERTCPILTKKVKKKEKKINRFPLAYVGYLKDLEERKKSSSGGIFIALAQAIIAEKGVVYGACYDKNFMVKHQGTTELKDLYKLQGSKYVQSRMENCFQKIKENLNRGQLVLFCGTTCQIAGLKGFLRNKEYNNLICVDLICKGIPSPKIWKSYLNNLLGKESPESINFKSKKYGWDLFAVSIKSKKKNISHIGQLDPYMQLFFQHLSIRPVCFSCPFKEKNRISDITLADCWGYENIAPELYDNNGLSSVLIHTDKGLEIWKKIQSKIICKGTSFEKVILFNPYYLNTAEENASRDKFFEDYLTMDFSSVLKKYTQTSFTFKLKSHLRAYKKLLERKYRK